MPLAGGRLFAAVRLDAAAPGLLGDSREYQGFVDTAHPRDAVGTSYSDDLGANWSAVKVVLPPSAAPAHLLLLADGRIVMTYGVRLLPRGVQAIASTDNGATWDFGRRYVLAWHGADANVGYPGSVVLNDGSILTSYYVRRAIGSDVFSDVSA